MPARTGADFLRGLRDKREVWLGGERVTDPMEHPALRGAAEAIAAVYDLHYQ
jgi:aromatic ring hydroxylase